MTQPSCYFRCSELENHRKKKKHNAITSNGCGATVWGPKPRPALAHGEGMGMEMGYGWDGVRTETGMGLERL